VEAEDRLAALEAEVTLMRSRIRTLADAGETDQVIRLYRRIEALRVELDAVRMVVARRVRIETRQMGYNSALDVAEHRLAERLALLGVPEDPAMRRVFG
jgi:hypothetical protein